MPAVYTIRRCLAALTLVVMSVSLAGCFDQRTIMTFNPDGSFVFETQVRADREMKDVAAAFEAFAAYDTTQQIAKHGLCGAAALEANKHAEQPLKVRQFTDAKNFVCIFTQNFSSIAATDRSYLFKSQFLRIVSTGTRRYKVTLDFGVMRGLSALLETGAIAGLQQKFGITDPNEVDALYLKLRTAYAAMLKIMTRNREIVFEVRGARILSTSGTRSADGTSAKFRFTWPDIFDALMGKDSDPAKLHVVELVY